MMDRISPISLQSHLRTLSGAGQLGAKPEIPELQTLIAPGEAEGANDFRGELAEQIDRVNTRMIDADQKVEDLATGKSQDVHSTLIALQKADISFRMLLEVRNKVIRAYEEVMRTQA